MYSALINNVVFIISAFSWSPPHFAFISANVPYYCANAVVTINGSNINVVGTCGVDRVFSNGFN